MALQLDSAATESFAAGERQPWVFLLPTQAASHFLLFVIFRVFLITLAGRFIIVIAGALARARVWEVGSRAVFGIVDGLGAMAGRALRRGVFMVRASTPFAVEGGRGAGGVGVLKEGRRGLGGASSRGATRRHGGREGVNVQDIWTFRGVSEYIREIRWVSRAGVTVSRPGRRAEPVCEGAPRD
jgi:hypothetical protein